ncbi:hypothetical protein E6C72_13255 [Azospirillum sp. TSH100]|nr:hypothetical protein E6C72_13255 [Azospirillum sp. TSH100]
MPSAVRCPPAPTGCTCRRNSSGCSEEASFSHLSSPLPPGERVRVRGTHCDDLFGCAEPPHPNLLPQTSISA